MKRILSVLMVAAFFAAGIAPSQAQDAKFPSPSGFVNDYAGVLSGGTKTKLEGLLSSFERKTTAEIAVLTVSTTAPLTIEQYAVELFQKWGIGKKGRDNGILILVVPSDRKVRIEVGYGLEGAVTDLQSKMIIEQVMIPAFKAGDYDQGISGAAALLTKIVAGEYGVEFDPAKQGVAVPVRRRAKRSPLGSLFTLLFFMLIFGFRFGTMFFLMSGGGGYWSGGSRGSFGGGFGGFGGGMSGGGGASGSW